MWRPPSWATDIELGTTLRLKRKRLPTLSSDESETALTLHLNLKIKIMHPIHPVCMGVKSIIRKQNGHNLVHYGSCSLTDIANVRHNVAQASLETLLFVSSNKWRVVTWGKAFHSDAQRLPQCPQRFSEVPTGLPRSCP